MTCIGCPAGADRLRPGHDVAVAVAHVIGADLVRTERLNIEVDGPAVPDLLVERIGALG